MAGKRLKRRNRNQTGCYACKKKKHNTNKTRMVRVDRPDGAGTVHVCQAKEGRYEKA